MSKDELKEIINREVGFASPNIYQALEEFYPIEEKMYTREEIVGILNDFIFKEIELPRYKISYLNKWFEQNVKQ